MSSLCFFFNFLRYFVAIKTVDLVTDVLQAIWLVKFLCDGVSCYFDGHLFVDDSYIITLGIIFCRYANMHYHYAVDNPI